jgi:hypothetical protein
MSEKSRINNKLICQYCNKQYACRQSIDVHIKKCKMNPSRLIKDQSSKTISITPVVKKYIIQKQKEPTRCHYCGKNHDDKCVLDPTHHLYNYVIEHIKTCKNAEEVTRLLEFTRNLPIIPNEPRPPQKDPIYFNVHFDLYKLLCESHNKEWAHNYLFYTIHKYSNPYIDVCNNYIVKPNGDQGPIRVKDKTLLVLHQEKDKIVNDPDWQIFGNCMKNIIQNAILKAWNSFNDAERINKASKFIAQMQDLQRFENSENDINFYRSEVKKIHNYVLCGNDNGTTDDNRSEGRPTMQDYNDKILKLASPKKLTLEQKKTFLKSLPQET